MTTIRDFRTPADRDAFSKGEPAIYANVPFRYYLAHPGVSRSALMTMLEATPAHYRHERQHPDHKVSEAFLWGSAVHCRLQEPEEFAARYVRGPVNPDTGEQFGATTKTWAAAQAAADAAGQFLYADKWCVDAMAEAVKTHPDTKRILEGRPMIEATAIWKDPATGLLCKARPDNLRVDLGLFIDVKTTETASPHGFAKSAATYGYFDQIAHYGLGLSILLGRDFDGFLVAVEKAPPHAVACYRIGEAEVHEGRRRVAWALAKIAECEKSGEWPGYREADLYAPKWWHDELDRVMSRSAGPREPEQNEDPIWMGGVDREPSFNR